MKRVVSVSLGSAVRDHSVTMRLLGEDVQLERRGTNGDLEIAIDMVSQLDGSVDAIGLGGIDRYLVVAGQWYEIRDAARLAAAAQRTPVVDGSGLKDTLERRIIRDLDRQGVIRRDQAVLMVSAMDRFGMAETFDALGYSLVAGDLIFSSHINYPIRSAAELAELAKKLVPELVKMPFNLLYPVGDAQLASGDPQYQQYFYDAEIIAGDFHYIRRYLPHDIGDKLIITNTTTSRDIEFLQECGIRRLVTTTPVLDGRSFGTNVMEAALVAVSGCTPQQAEWAHLVERAPMGVTVRDLTS